MATATVSSARTDSIAKLVPGGALGLAQLTDDELLANTRRLVGKSNQLLAALLVHLAEVEARGVHRTRRCASLYTYCIYELRFSEDAAARRSAAARFVKHFPALFDAVAVGELHLTGLLMIGPHLTAENQLDVLGRAKFRTKKELAKLVRDLNPLPDVPDRIEPLGAASLQTPRNPSWAEFAASLCPPVRELPAGEQPGDWADDGIESRVAGARLFTDREALPVGPVPLDLPPITGPQHYQLQFTTVEEHVQLIDKAKALLASERPTVTLGELHFEAMKMLVASLEKKKFAATEAANRNQASEAPRQRGAGARAAERKASEPRRSRYIPAAVRREVYRRDGGRCCYVDARGERCCETSYLELHHLKPFAREGANQASNLALCCRAHNALAAEADFGRNLIAQKRDSSRHEALCKQTATKEAERLLHGA